jgi:hypothetical protein
VRLTRAPRLFPLLRDEDLASLATLREVYFNLDRAEKTYRPA